MLEKIEVTMQADVDTKIELVDEQAYSGSEQAYCGSRDNYLQAKQSTPDSKNSFLHFQQYVSIYDAFNFEQELGKPDLVCSMSENNSAVRQLDVVGTCLAGENLVQEKSSLKGCSSTDEDNTHETCSSTDEDNTQQTCSSTDELNTQQTFSPEQSTSHSSMISSSCSSSNVLSAVAPIVTHSFSQTLEPIDGWSSIESSISMSSPPSVGSPIATVSSGFRSPTATMTSGLVQVAVTDRSEYLESMNFDCGFDSSYTCSGSCDSPMNGPLDSVAKSHIECVIDSPKGWCTKNYFNYLKEI